MAKQPLSAQADTTGTRDARESELREELARNREEVLRLRDLLIGKDAELGALRGRAAELEASSARLLNLAARARSRVPRFVLSARAGLRKRRGTRG